MLSLRFNVKDQITVEASDITYKIYCMISYI